MTKSRCDPGIKWHRGRLCPQLCTTMNADVVNCLICTGQGTPVPPDMSTVLDHMFPWGRTVNPRWHHKTLELMDCHLKMGDLDRKDLPPSKFAMEVIKLRVLQMLDDQLSHRPLAKTEGHNRW